MIGECNKHGFFRDEVCPVCGDKGRFIMKDSEVERLSRSMASILRHGNMELGMDDQGYVDLRELIDAVKERNPWMHWLAPRHVLALAETDARERYQVYGDYVRATYGHTVELDMELATDNVPDWLFYPIEPEYVDEVLGEGLGPSDRSMVHLSSTRDNAVTAGTFRIGGEMVILAIDTTKCFEMGHDIGRATKAVYLCDFVPAECISVSEEPEYGEE